MMGKKYVALTSFINPDQTVTNSGETIELEDDVAATYANLVSLVSDEAGSATDGQQPVVRKTK